MNGFERYQHQIGLLKIAIDNQCAKEYIMEIDQCALVMLCLYYKGIYSNVYMIDNKIPSSVDAILMLNNLAFDNLRDFPWTDITNRFDTYLIGVFISLIDRPDLKLAVLRCILDEWQHLSKEDKESFDIGQGVEEYCQKELEYISSAPKYDITNFTKEEVISELEPAVDGLSGKCNLNLPRKLQTEDAKAILKIAVEEGVCALDHQGRYKWNEAYDIQLCAYFCAKMSDYLSLTSRVVSGNYVTSWEPFTQIFGYTPKQLKSAKQGYQKGAQDVPTDHEIIDKIFERTK